jgi:hypothetical protein
MPACFHETRDITVLLLQTMRNMLTIFFSVRKLWFYKAMMDLFEVGVLKEVNGRRTMFSFLCFSRRGDALN